MLEHIAWFFGHWREHKLIIFAAAMILGVPAAVSASIWFFKLDLPTINLKGKPQSSNTTPEKRSEPALRIRFRDGAVGYVALTFTAAVDPDHVIDLVKTYGKQDRALAELKTSVLAAAYKVLETVSIEEARQNRGRMESLILDATKDSQKRTFHMIYAINLLDIEPAK